jgi:hypothetical protein
VITAAVCACASATALYTPQVTYAQQSPQSTNRQYVKKTFQKRTWGWRAHLEDPIRLNSINAQTRPLAARDDLTPVLNRAGTAPQRPIRPKHSTKRRRRLQPFCSIDMLEYLPRHRQIIPDWLLIRYLRQSTTRIMMGRGNVTAEKT